MKLNWLRSRKFWLFIFCGILIALLGSRLPLKDWFVVVNRWLLNLGPNAIPAFSILYLFATIFGFPNILLILVAGTTFGLVKGIITVSIADTLGGIVCFLLGRTIARKRIKKWISQNPSFVQLDYAVGKKAWKILLLTRLSPLVPSNILNYSFSCTKVNFWQYCFFSWLGMLPMISLYVYLGSFGVSLLQEGLTPRKIALQSVGLVLAIGAAAYTTRVTKRALTPECPVDEEPQAVESSLQRSSREK
ncbi:MAG TPA: TVP38/TMEM64 family protein [Leptolyngbyaceae cyanobacterium M33_DOE_097]|uniref:TVP38/TMEM64 family membrane protein n=1 Tax=Oscillatoriales cyanobacterium SpSt-418 TaxID=2282169 RepID=A0A7C3PKC1_9CYAN|nr:TVP38/TMEM64 family protein [Leptolyngbyaceae cyanobacterium M33_DOE_097]